MLIDEDEEVVSASERRRKAALQHDKVVGNRRKEAVRKADLASQIASMTPEQREAWAKERVTSHLLRQP